jgi:competence protein ComEC
MVLAIEAFDENCRRATVVVSPRQAQTACAATMVDRRVSQAHGAIALRWTGDHFEETAARPTGLDRPWARAPRPAASAVRDATPDLRTLEPGDQ